MKYAFGKQAAGFKAERLSKLRRCGLRRSTTASDVAGLFGALLLVFSGAAAADTGIVVWYLEQEAGIEPYKVRYIVTEDYMRSDEGGDEGGYVLFNRKDHSISSVVPENRTILRIDGAGEIPEAPQQLNIDIKQTADEKAPKVAGKTPVTVELMADNELCYSAVIVPGFLEPVREAFQAFSRSLAVQQHRTLDNTPKEFQTPCFLSRYIYAGDFYLRRGVPLLDWNDEGKRRELLNYETGVELDAGLFSLPDDYYVIRASGS